MPHPLPHQSELSAMTDELARESAERRSKNALGAEDILSILNSLDGILSDDIRKLVADLEKISNSPSIAALAAAFLAGLVIGNRSHRDES
jgi:uncharacterized small protein (DUF1192 family)